MKAEKILALAKIGALHIWKVAEQIHKRENTEKSHKEVTEAWRTVEEIEEVIKMLS